MEQEQHFIDYIEQSIIRNWNLNALTDYKGATLQYKDVARKIAKFHIVLESAGIQPGDKIAVCGRNSAHWAVTFLATITYGAVIVPILHEFKADNIHNIVNHSEARLLFVGDQVWENLNEDAMPQLLGVILMTEFTPVVCRDKRLMEAFEHRNTLYGQRYPKNFRPEHICYRKDEPEELAIINYTSGTTGYSKGVMLPYRSLWSNVNYCHEMLPVKPGDNMVAMLPMGHVFGMTYDFLYGFSAGAHLYFLTRMPTPKIIAQSFAEIKPRVISCVPLIVEKIIKKNILPRVDNKIGKLLLHVPIINDKIRALARKEAMEIFGGNFDEIIIGGAPFNAEVERFLKQIGFPYTIAYGMTECGPLISYDHNNEYVPGSCGQILKGIMKVRIDSEDPYNKVGEIQVSGENVMKGYYKNDEATQNVFTEDGWLRTGDLGTIDHDNRIFIRGRSKTMILGASGQNIYPEEIESKLNNLPFVMESIIIEKNGKLVGLVYPDYDTVDSTGVSHEDLPIIMEQNRIELNKLLAPYEAVSALQLYPTEFEKTPKKSIKRYLYSNY